MRKILWVKRAKRTRFSPKKAKPGAFWVLERIGTVGDGYNQMRKPSVRTNVNHTTMQHKKTGENPVFSPVLWQGQKDLSRLPPRVLFPCGERPAPTEAGAKAGAVACVPPARTAPSARGFAVDVGTHQRELGRAGVAQFLPQVPGRVVLFWCCERLWQQFFKFFTHSASFENPTPLLGGFCCWKAPGGTHSGPRG